MRAAVRRALARMQAKRRVDSYLRSHAVRKLQLGTGGNVLDGWLNTDVHVFEGARGIVYLDARKAFPLPDRSFDLVFSEHMLEHLDYAEGRHVLAESFRVLRSGDRIRVATPSLDRLIRLFDDELTDVQRRYIRWAVQSFVPYADAELPSFVLNNFLRAWGHRFVYDERTLRHALEQAGFSDVEERPVGEAGLEHHLAEAPEFNEYETLVLEARRP